ncbi:MAG TPA: ABC transporter permease subunit [Pirellulales bacterium]|nr:ABC transporter permease subunit [Pirellulales bacterium]
MNRALWAKSIGDARLLLAALVALMFGFEWLFVWLTSLVELGAVATFLQAWPGEFQSLLGMPLAQAVTPTGRLALGYIDPVVILATVTWGLARGSDAISGEIGRGTMELLLAQPVRRITIVAVHAAVTTAGAALIGLAAWLGTCQGLWAVGWLDQVAPRHFVSAAVNVFALTFFLGAASTLVSSWESVRWRAIGVMGAFFIIELIIKIIARLAPKLDWLMYCTVLGAFQPQILAVEPARAWHLSLRYDGTLIGLGVCCYLLATIIFCRRDLPAPL